jgi:hypothetical protein
LYSITAAGSILSDGVMNEFDPSFSGSVDMLDVLKLTNVNESISLVTGHISLSAERRGNLQPRDTIFYKLENLKSQEYEFEFTAENIPVQGLRAFLIDRYLQQRNMVPLSGTTKIRFSVTGNPGSYAADRFILVFQKSRERSIPVKPKQAGEVFVYPNPVISDRILLTFSKMPPGKYEVKLINQSAQVIQELIITVTSHQHNQAVPLSRKIPGNYTLIITGSDGATTFKHIVIK